MKTLEMSGLSRALASLLALLLLLCPVGGAFALGVGDLDGSLQDDDIVQTRPSTGDGAANPFGDLEGLFQGIADFFRQFLTGLGEIFKEIFGDAGGGNSGGTTGGGNNGGESGGNSGGDTVPPPTADNPPTTDTPPTAENPPATGGNHPKDDSWLAKFDPANVISDAEFCDVNSLTQAQVQRFLESKGSVLAKRTGGVLPSQAIVDAARKNGINPKLLITRLQQEQGLVSAKTATQYKLDWALGCGALDGGTYLNQFKGFAKQMDGGAKTLKRWFDDGVKKGGKVAMKIDGKSITTKNAATYSLYKYTPHLAGAKLHWQVYKGYFGK